MSFLNEGFSLHQVFSFPPYHLSFGMSTAPADSRGVLPSREWSSATLGEGLGQVGAQQVKVEDDEQILAWRKELEVGFETQIHDILFVFFLIILWWC